MSCAVMRHPDLLAAALVFMTLAAAPHDLPDPAAAPSQQPGAQEEAAADETAPRTLDELLDLDEDESAADTEDAARRRHEEALRKALEEVAIGDAFTQAIDQMALAADLLDQEFDCGLGTQRVQEEILLRLEILIQRAKRPQAGGACGSRGEGGTGDRRPDPGRRGERPADEGERADGDVSDGQAQLPPQGERGDLAGPLQETRAEWGNLPQRVREMLLQGRREKFSSLYERLTREYYRRLAEEDSP